MERLTNGARQWKLVRDVIIVVVAVFILVHETLSSAAPDEKLLAVALLMLGIPAALRVDERRRNGGG